MIFKYSCTIDAKEKHYYTIEGLFKDALSEYSFIDAVDFDGEYLNLIFDEANIPAAYQQEAELNLAVKNTIKKLYTKM